jgi:hypothetical protein
MFGISSGHRARVLLGTLLILLFVSARTGFAAQSAEANVCHLRTTERVIAVGDVHGAHDEFVGILKAAGLLDSRSRWIGGRSILIQTGDILDRGPDSRKALDLLRRLEREAARAGGRVYALLGNHEVMRMVSDWRYVSAQEVDAFRTQDSADLRERAFAIVAADAARQAQEQDRPYDERRFRNQFDKEIPLGYLEMRQAFSPSGDYGKWLRERPAVVRINDIVFVHGGISSGTAALGCDGINQAVRSDLAVARPTPEQVRTMLASSETGPLWYRGLADEPAASFAPQVASILHAVGARAIVIGHTAPAGFRIATRFDGRVIQIDTGMLGGTFYPGGVASALEIRGDSLAAIYQTGREGLSARVPALSSSTGISALPSQAP